MRFKRRTLDTVHRFAANTTTEIQLPRDRFIRQIQLRLTVTGNTGAAVTPHEDEVANLVRAIRIVANGTDHLLNLNLKDLWLLDRYEHGISGVNSLITAVSQTGVTLGICESNIDFTLSPRDPLDLPCMIPAHQLSSLNMFVDWLDSAALGTGYTVTAGHITVTILEVDLTAEDITSIEPFITIWEGSMARDITSATDRFEFEVDLPTGRIIRRLGVVAIRAGARSDVQLPFVRIDNVVEDRIVEQIGWNELRADNRHDFGLEALEPGFAILNLEKLGGLDTRGAKSGDFKFRANTIAPSGVTRVRLIAQEIS